MSSDLTTVFAQRGDLHQSPMHMAVLGDLGWENIPLSPGSTLYLRRLGPISVAKLQRPESIDLTKLKLLRKKYHILTLYLEPKLNDPLQPSVGWRVEPFAHSKTSLLDLRLSEKNLLTSFNQNTRRNLRPNPDLTFTTTALSALTTTQIDGFFTLQHEWHHAKKVATYPENMLRAVFRHYATHGHLHVAYYQNNPCAHLLSLYHNRVATYYIAAANETGYAQAAPTHLTWEMIKTAKKAGCDILDFGGIYDERYPKMYKGWQGFTKFKEGFRPTVITYPETRLLLFW